MSTSKQAIFYFSPSDVTEEDDEHRATALVITAHPTAMAELIKSMIDGLTKAMSSGDIAQVTIPVGCGEWRDAEDEPIAPAPEDDP